MKSTQTDVHGYQNLPIEFTWVISQAAALRFRKPRNTIGNLMAATIVQGLVILLDLRNPSLALHIQMRLLAILEVPKEERVYCQADTCTRAVYKAIHVIEDQEKISILGSQCFAKLYGSHKSTTPEYSGGSPRVLSKEERELLLQNTKSLLERLEAEHQVQATQPEQPAPTEKAQSQHQSHNEEILKSVRCSFCRSEMETALPRRPVRGFRCPTCRESGLDDFSLRQKYRR
jgi:hypothetical protein